MNAVGSFFKKFYSSSIFKDSFGGFLSGLFNMNSDGVTPIADWLSGGAMSYNAEQSKLQRQNEWDMWHANNAYNTPAAQTARMKDAGLNPALMYGGTSSIASPSSGMSEASVGSQNPLMSILSAANTAFDIKNRTKITDAQVNLMDAQAENARARTVTEDERRQLLIENLKASVDKIRTGIQHELAEIDQLKKTGRLTEAQIDKISFDKMIAQMSITLDAQRVSNETELTKAQVQQLNAATRKAIADAQITEREYQEMIWTYAIRAAGLEAQVNLTKAQTDQATATAKKLGAETDILEPQAINARSWSADMSGANGKFNEIGSNITFQIVQTLKDFAFLLK